MARRGRILALAIPALAGAMLVATPATGQYSPGYQFLKAVKDGDGNAMVELLEKNATTLVNSQDLADGESGLHILVRKRNVTWMRYLLQQGANPNIQDKRGVTPLVLAAQIGYLEGVEELIKYKARVDVGNATGETPLISAVHRRDVPMIRALLKGGADPDRADSSGRTAREIALEDGANGQLISEIQKNEKPKSQREGARTYGPSI